ncbi:MAG: hypothetical protein ACRDZ8_10995 [Acidimicrobiales bacterium]
MAAAAVTPLPRSAACIRHDGIPPLLDGPGAQAGAALSLGQQMNQLYVTVAARTPPPSPEPPSALAPPPAAVDPLQGLPTLNAEEQFQSQLLAVDSALFRLAGRVAEAGLVMPSGADVIEGEATLLGDAGCRTVAALHTLVLEVLEAVSGLLSGAYDLGSSLSSLRDRVGKDPTQLPAVLAAGQFDHLRNLINGLGSALPPHAAKSVVGALNNWEDWLAAGTIRGRPIDWNADGATISQAFTRQCGVWLSLLSGQRLGVDLLTTGDYVDAGEALLREYLNLGLRFAAQWWPVVVLGVLVTGALIAAFLIWGRGVTRGIGTITTLLAGIGVGLKTVTSTLERTVSKVSDSLWAAELDRSIIRAATKLPAGDRPVVTGMQRPLQRQAKMAAQTAVASRQHAIAARTAKR